MIIKRQERHRLVTFAIAVAAVTTPAWAQQQPISGSGDWYYEVNGAEPVSAAPNGRVRTIGIDASAELRMPNSCTSMDPMISVSGILDDVKDGVDEAETAMYAAATNAVAALPTIVLQRAFPGLYDHFQQALVGAKGQVNIAVKSCQDMVEAGSLGGLHDWVQVSRTGTMRQATYAPGVGPVEAVEAADTINGDAGIRMPSGMRGGAGQDPLKVTEETVASGYNRLNEQPLDRRVAPTVPVGDPTPRLVELWPDPPAAVAWATEVVGEKSIQTCSGCTPQTTPGNGLLPMYEEEREILAPLLADLVTGTTAPTPANRATASASNIVVTTQLIEALRSIQDDQERAFSVGRITSDIATARTVEKALALRRMILTGQRVPEIEAVDVMQEDLDAMAAELKQEVENFLFEDQVKAQLLSRTAQIVLNRAEGQATRALATPSAAANDGRPLAGGGVND